MNIVEMTIVNPQSSDVSDLATDHGYHKSTTFKRFKVDVLARDELSTVLKFV